MKIALLAACALWFAACVRPVTSREKPPQTGGVGAVVGSVTGSAGAGVNVRTGTDLLRGALIGDQVPEHERREYQTQLKLQQQQLELERLRSELERLKKNVDGGIY